MKFESSLTSAISRSGLPLVVCSSFYNVQCQRMSTKAEKFHQTICVYIHYIRMRTDVKSERGWVDKFKSHGCDVEHRFGERIGVFLYHACRGYDPKPVHNKGPPKSLSVEDSFRNCTTLKQVEVWL